MRKYHLLLALFVLSACNSNYNSGEQLDQDLRIQAMKRKGATDDQVYNVRIFPKMEILEANKSISKNMTYHIDSSFYFIKNKARVYPQSVECIANGVVNSFEYLIRFDPDGLSEKEDLPLVYQDKYINQKIYQLLLK